MHRLVGLVLALACFAGPAWAVPPTAQMAPHRAFYVLQLGGANPGSDIAGADGALVIEWTETCEGYATTQRIVTRLWGDGGEGIVNDLRTTAFENKDLTEFDFTLTNRAQGEVTERIAGVAKKGGNGEGHLRYQRPKGEEGTLPASVIFPTEHAFTLLTAAAAGEQQVERTVFEGGAPDEVFTVVSHLGKRVEPGADTPKGLEGVAAWPVIISYYRLEGEASLPEYEIRFHLFANGIADQLFMDYGDFSLRGRLERLELLASPSC